MASRPASQLRFLHRSGPKVAFLREFLLNPRQVGAVVPSSKRLTESMFQSLQAETIEVYVEYGPGTGAFTELALQRLPCLQRSILLEINPVFQELLRNRYPAAEIYRGAQELQVWGAPQVDLVVSGLPFTNIPWRITQQTLHEAYGMLKPGGTFRTFLYLHTFFLPKNQALYRLIQMQFARVSTRVVFRNLPPAIVIEAWK